MFRLVRGSRRGALLGAIATLVVVLFLWWRASQWYELQLIGEQRATAAVAVSARGNALAAAINRRLVRLQGLTAFVQANADRPDFVDGFETYARGLYAGSYGIRNVAVAPGGVVRYVYPLEGNERVIGYDPLLDMRPEVRSDVEATVATGEPVLTGPTDLLQGGIGVIARQAVTLDGTYWGLSNLVLDITQLLAEAGVTPEAENVQFAIRDEVGRVFYGSQSTFAAEPLVARVQVADEEWEIAAAPAAGWVALIRRPLFVFRVAGLIISLLLASVAYLVTDRQARLSRAVTARTREIASINEALYRDIAERKRAEAALAEREEQYRSIFRASYDGIFINDLETGDLVDFNTAAHQMHGYSEAEFRALQPSGFIDPSSLGAFEEYLETLREGRVYQGRAIFTRRKNGERFVVDVRGARFSYRGRPHGLAIVRDVTEEVEAYNLLERRVAERTRELHGLLDIGRSLTSTLELQPLLEKIVRRLSDVLESTVAAVVGYDAHAHEMEVLIFRAPEIPEQLLQRWPILPGSLDEVVLFGTDAVLIDDIRDTSRLAQLWRERADRLYGGPIAGIHSWIGVPLSLKERPIGMLMVGHGRVAAYSSYHVEVARAFAAQAAVAVENARLYEQARSLAALRERQRLARELHDSVSQALYGIALGARTTRILLERSALGDETSTALSGPVDYILNLAEAALSDMRALIFELRPESLETEGLLAALSHRAEALRARYHLDVRTELTEEPPLPLSSKEALYRVAQEALFNIVKHADAGTVNMSLYRQNGDVVLEVWDDGRGFDTNAPYPGHLGLRSMRERIEELGGTLAITSRAGTGTHISARLPLPTSATPGTTAHLHAA